MTNADTYQLRDELLTFVMDSDLPPTTDECARGVTPITERCPCLNLHDQYRRDWHRSYEEYRGRMVVAIACDGTTPDGLWTRYQDSTRVYQVLRWLEARGLLARDRHPGDSRVIWRFTGTPSTALAELEASWERQ